MFRSVTFFNTLAVLHMVAGYPTTTINPGNDSVLIENSSIQVGEATSDALYFDTHNADLEQIHGEVSSNTKGGGKATIISDLQNQEIKCNVLSIPKHGKNSEEANCTSENLQNSVGNLQLVVNVIIAPDQQWQAKLDHILAKIDSMQYKLTEKTVKLCVIAINADRIDTAVEEFMKLNNDTLISEVVSNTYHYNIKSLERVLKFVHELAQNQWDKWYKGYTALFNKIQSSNYLHKSDMLVLASRVKTILDENSQKITVDVKNEFEKIKERFPPIVKSLIWEQVLLQNNGECLYSPHNSFKYDGNRRRVFTWTPKMEKFPEGYWKFEAATIDQKYFRIKNMHFNEYLYAPLINGKREAFTWIEGDSNDNCSNDQCTWDVILYSENSIKLRNIRFEEEYLGVGEELYTQNRRGVFTWIPKADESPFVWEVVA